MAGEIAWAIGIIGLLLAVETGWSEYREWRARREAVRRGRALIGGYLPPR
jgi:hypothetical protein